MPSGWGQGNRSLDFDWGFKIWQGLNEYKRMWLTHHITLDTKLLQELRSEKYKVPRVARSVEDYKSPTAKIAKLEEEIENSLDYAKAHFYEAFHHLDQYDDGITFKDLKQTLTRYQRWLAELTPPFRQSGHLAQIDEALFTEFRRYLEEAILEMNNELISRESQGSSPDKFASRVQSLEKAIPEIRAEIAKLTRELRKRTSGAQTLETPSLSEKTWFIDALNICRLPQQENRPASLTVLLTLLIELLKRGEYFYCIFDANARFALDEASKERKQYEDLYQRYAPAYFYEVTGGMQADELVVRRADRYGAAIISSDRLRPYWKQYPWLEAEQVKTNKRLHAGVVNLGCLTIPTLNIDAEIKDDLRLLVQEFDRRMTAHTAVANPH
jgi:hypothetical protein